MRTDKLFTTGRIVFSATLLLLLSACGGGSTGSSEGGPVTSQLSGSVGDGPVIGATVEVRNAQGVLLASAGSDANAGYRVQVSASPDDFPLVVEVSGGIDVVTGRAPDFSLSSAVFATDLGNGRANVNINPFTTFVRRVAESMGGGLSRRNADNARRAVYAALGFGIDPAAIPDPAATPIDAGNIAMMIKASESLGEMIRRTHEVARGRDASLDTDAVIAALAADLVDGVLDGLGAPGADPRLAATATITSAQVLVESLTGNLVVDAGNAAGRLDDAIALALPGAGGVGTGGGSGGVAPRIASVPNPSAMLAQARIAIAAARALSPSQSLATLAAMIDALRPGSLPAEADATLPADSSLNLGDAINVIGSASQPQIDTVNQAVREASAGTLPPMPSNTAPVISGTPQTRVAEDSAYRFTPGASDADGDTLTFRIANKPAWASFNRNTGTLSGTPRNQHVGITRGIVISVSDGQASTPLPAFDLRVSNVNDAPTLSGNPATTVVAGNAYNFQPSAADVDGDPLTFSIANKPAWASFDAATGRLSGTPTETQVGTSRGVQISVSDGTVSVSLPAFDLTVSSGGGNTPPANRAPTISGSPATRVDEDSAYSFRPQAADADGDALTFSISGKPAWANFSTSTGRLSGTPRNADVGTTNGIVISVSDGQATAALPAFGIQVVNTNDAPTVSGTPGTSVQEGASYAFRPTASDPDGDPLTWSIAGKPAWASFDPATGALTGTPAAGDAGSYTGIVISVSDGTASTSLPAFGITVTSAPTGSMDCSLASVLCVDDNAGANQEYSNIQNAVDNANPGDTVLVFDGNYNGFVVNRSGTNANPIVVKANAGNARITGTAPGYNETIRINNSSHVTIEGFIVDQGGSGGYGIGARGATGSSPMRGLVIRNNTVRNSGSTNIYLSQVADSLAEGNTSYNAGEHGIYLANGGSDNTTLRNNTIYNNAVDGIHFNGDLSVSGDGLHTGLVIEGNTIHDNGVNGLDMDGVQNSVIRNNVIYANGRHAVRAFNIDSAAGPANFVIANNTLLASGGNWPIKLTQDNGGHVIFNNILLGSGGSGGFSVENTNLTTASNLLTDNVDAGGSSYSLSSWQALGYGSGSAVAPASSALFVNAAAGDYRPASGSPAIDAGRASLQGVAAPLNDILDAARPVGGGYDIGAHEQGGTPGSGGGSGGDTGGGSGGGAGGGSGGGGGTTPCTSGCSKVLQLNWNPNPESDVAGYNVYHGTSPGVYTDVFWVGNNTSYQYTATVAGNHYFAISAVDTSQNESPKSAEVVMNVTFP